MKEKQLQKLYSILDCLSVIARISEKGLLKLRICRNKTVSVGTLLTKKYITGFMVILL